MDRQFLDLYNRELAVLLEQASEFAEEYPGIAERLGGLVAERMDPMAGALLEGTAFLAARVQLKLKQEFPEFTSNLLDQLVPNYLAPTPSVMLAKIHPPFADPALRDGKRIRKGRDFPGPRQHRISLALASWTRIAATRRSRISAESSRSELVGPYAAEQLSPDRP